VELSITGYEGKTWKFLMPRGWREYASGRTLAEVCAFQWVTANEAILAAKDQIGADRWVDVRYETLIESPTETVTRVLQQLGLPPDEQVRQHAATLDRRVTKAVSAPSARKWMRDVAEIQPILPQIRPMMERLGYEDV
jgi:Sulfotransferase family